MSLTKSLVLLLAAPILAGGVCKPTMLAGPAKLPDIRLPEGFSIALFAENVPSVRAMTYSPDG
ncbi:MAG TPA: hypothetical protein PKL41_12810, partial [Flavobacteriales bacterium]|nr:hypothetical protein [Flavobacteriales bacterium]